MKQLIHFTLLPLGGVLLACGTAHAEGNKTFNGALGVNRVVRSDASAANPRLSTAATVTVSFTQPVSRAGGFDAETNPFNNKVTAYLGGESRNMANQIQQFDAGLQFETGVYGNYTKGWTGLFSRGDTFVTAHIYNGSTDIAWRPASSYSANKDASSGKYISATGSITSDLTFTIIPNGASQATISAINVDNNTFVWNPNGNKDRNDPTTTATRAHPIAPWGAAAYNNANQGLATVKRVSGMTRSRPRKDELDGSQMSAAWSNCTLNGGSWIGHVDQDTTGFDSQANVPEAWDRRVSGAKTDDSRTTTSFSGIPGVTNVQARSGVGSTARYNSETVSVNLGTATLLTGDDLEWD